MLKVAWAKPRSAQIQEETLDLSPINQSPEYLPGSGVPANETGAHLILNVVSPEPTKPLENAAPHSMPPWAQTGTEESKVSKFHVTKTLRKCLWLKIVH